MRRHRPGSRGRTAALRSVSRRAAQGRARCLTRFGRTPGRVTTLAVTRRSAARLTLTFSAVGSNGSRAPAARRYIIKQSLRPIRSLRDFRRAPALCRTACTFDVVDVGGAITLEVTRLRRDTSYHYAVAALDNVSGRLGPRSRTVLARTR